MRKFLALFVFFTTCSICYAQLLSQKNLTGKWTVTKVTSSFDNMNLPESAMKDVIEMKKALHNSIFEFKQNGKFFIELADENSINKDFKKLNGKNWKLELEDNQIAIIDNEKEESGGMVFSIANSLMPDVIFSVVGLKLHMKKGLIISEIDYEKNMSKKPNEKSIEEKRKETYGEDLYELKKANEAKEAISYDDIQIIDGIAYFKDSNSLVKLKKIEARYQNGKLKMEGWFLDGKEDDVWTWYYKNGQVSQEKIFIKGKLDGVSKEWNENGRLTRKVNYKNGVKEDD